MRNIWKWQVFILSHKQETGPMVHVAFTKLSRTPLHLTVGMRLPLRARLHWGSPKADLLTTLTAKAPRAFGSSALPLRTPDQEGKKCNRCSQGWFSVTPRQPLVHNCFIRRTAGITKLLTPMKTWVPGRRQDWTLPASCFEAFSREISIKTCTKCRHQKQPWSNLGH